MYVLKNDDFAATEDKFIFSVEDTNPNKLFNNIFTIRWTRIHFISSSYNISETSGLLELPVKRTGNKHLVFLFFILFFPCMIYLFIHSCFILK